MIFLTINPSEIPEKKGYNCAQWKLKGKGNRQYIWDAEPTGQSLEFEAQFRNPEDKGTMQTVIAT